MKVKEYLVNRILKLEEELKQARNEKAGAVFGLQKLQEDVIKLNEKIEQYQIEREHIKQIITCNIGYNAYNHLELNIDIGNNDFKTLLAILDIKPEDYTECIENQTQMITTCNGCMHEAQPEHVYPCCVCNAGDRYKKKEDNNAETTD